MTTPGPFNIALSRRPAPGSPVVWALLAAGVGGTVGLATTRSVRDAVALAVVIGLAGSLAAGTVDLLTVLVGSLFLDIVSLGGITISRLVAPIALAVLIGAAGTRRLQIRLRGPAAWAMLYLAWAVASGLWTVSTSQTKFMLGSLGIALVFAFAFAAFVDTERKLRQSCIVIGLAAFGVGVFAVFAFAAGVRADLGSGRSQGGTDDPNLFAMYEIMALPLALAAASVVRDRRLRLLLYGSVVAVVAAVFVSLSRGGILTLLVIGALILVLPARTIFRGRSQKLLVIVVLAIAGVLGFQTSAPELLPRISAHSDPSGSGRWYIWHAATISIAEHPLLGVGYGGFQAVSNELLIRTPGVNFNQYELRPHGTAVHDLYLGTFAELGVVGLALVVGLLLSTALALRRAARAARLAGAEFLQRAANALLVSLASVCLASVFLSTDTSRALWIVIGLSMAVGAIVERTARAPAAASASPS